MRILAGALFSAAIVLTPGTAVAQTRAPASAMVEVALRDGSHLVGYVVSDDPTRLVLKTIAGADVTVPRGQVLSIAPAVGTIVGSEFRRDDALASKLFLGPTGRSLRRGEGYFAIDQFMLPVMQVGITDRLSFGVGKPFWFWTPAFWITPKFQLYRGASTSVATGVLHLVIPGFGVGGVGYVVATRGTRDDAVTIGGGWFYARDGDGDGGRAPVLIVGGEHRTGRRSKLVTENYIFRGGAMTMVGGRYIRDQFTFEVGVIVPTGSAGPTIPAPFVNFIWHSRVSGARGR